MPIKTAISSSNYSKLSQSLKKYLGRVKTIFHHVFQNSWNGIFIFICETLKFYLFHKSIISDFKNYD